MVTTLPYIIVCIVPMADAFQGTEKFDEAWNPGFNLQRVAIAGACAQGNEDRQTIWKTDPQRHTARTTGVEIYGRQIWGNNGFVKRSLPSCGLAVKGQPC
eukprot:scaffold120858_cov50-Phaeocystis_antarctica.AAC.1